MKSIKMYQWVIFLLLFVALAGEANQELSKLVFISENGMCDVYLDGDKKASLTFGAHQEMAKKTITDIEAGNYLIKIQDFTGGKVWYEGVLEVGKGEEIKIRIEPDTFQIFSRSTEFGATTSQINLSSEVGTYEIFLEGKKVMDLNVAGFSDKYRENFRDKTKFGNYLLNLKSYIALWSKGRTQIFPGQEIRIITDDENFEIISIKPDFIHSASEGKNAKILFLSEKGMCYVYLDGKRKASLGISPIDGMAKDEVTDLEPGVYLIKIESFSEIWYQGELEVNPGEFLKIRIEPNMFKIISSSWLD